jgi:serine/threonine protein kinase
LWDNRYRLTASQYVFLIAGSIMNEPTHRQQGAIDPAPSASPTIPESKKDNAPEKERSPEAATDVSVERSAARGGTGDFSFDSTAVELPAQTLSIPGYEIIGELGRGGMGIVYKAREIALDRLVALKVVTAGSLASAEQKARFRGEARAEARLQHPNIVQVHAVGEHEGFPYLSLEYMDGGSLGQKIARQPQPPRQAAQIVYLLSRAMAYAHQHGIIHRDLKPANVLLQNRVTTHNTNNTNQKTKEKQSKSASSRSLSSHSSDSCNSWFDAVPKIADFGLAKFLEEESGHTRSGNLMGTPSYMSPEQAGGRKNIGPATDIWALGVILYELLVGRTPFTGASTVETLENVRTREPVPPTQLQPKVPIDLDTICLQCLRKEQSQRYASADELADDLRRFLDGEPIRARPIGAMGRLLRWSRRNPRVAALSAAVLLLLATVAVVSTVFVFVLEGRQRQLETAWMQARSNEEMARREGQRADDKAKEALARYQLLHEALVVVIDKVQRDLQAVPSTAQARREILEAAIKVLQKNVAQGRDSTRLPERSLATSHMIMGHILREQHKTKEAIEHYNQCHAILETLYRANPASDKATGNYSVSLSVQADLALELQNDVAVAEKLYRQALALQEESLAHRPEQPELAEAVFHRLIANSHHRLGEILMRSQPKPPQSARERQREAQQHFEKAREQMALALPEEDTLGNHLKMEQICYHLGEMNERLDRPAEARRAYELCLAERKKLAADLPADTHRQMEKLRLYGKIGDLYLFADETETARRYYSEAVAANEELARRDRTPNSRILLSLNYYRLATAYLRRRERGLADDYYRKCLDLRVALQKQHPDVLGLKIDLMIAQGRCGLHREAAAFAHELRQRYPTDTRQLLNAACGYALSAFSVVVGKSEEKLSAEERRLRQDYCDRAVEALRQAKKNNYNDVKNLQIEPDLDPIRSDKGFQALLREYSGASSGP